jgi:hypothetical protein
MNDFHQRLRPLHTARTLIQTRVAEPLGVSPHVYTRWGNRGVTPLLGAVVTIASVLDVSRDEPAGRQEASSEAHIHNLALHDPHKKVN